MTKATQNILIFRESKWWKEYYDSVKIANSYMNRFTVDEDASFELIGVFDFPLWYFGTMHNFYFEELEQIATEITFLDTRESETHLIFALKEIIALKRRSKFCPQRINENLGLKYLMMKCHIKTAMITTITMMRANLFRQEAMENYVKIFAKAQIFSVHDDLDNFLEKLQNDKFKYKHENRNEKCVQSYYFPKLTNEEEDLVESRDISFMARFYRNREIFAKSSAMFVKGYCYRRTFQIDNSSSYNWAAIICIRWRIFKHV